MKARNILFHIKTIQLRIPSCGTMALYKCAHYCYYRKYH